MVFWSFSLVFTVDGSVGSGSSARQQPLAWQAKPHIDMFLC